MILNLKFSGIPFAKQSVRSRIAQNNAGENYIQHYQTDMIKLKEMSIAWQAKQQLPKGFIPFDGPVVVKRLFFVFPPLKSISKNDRVKLADGGWIPKTTKPDLTDNLQKGLFDALQGIVYLNDSQIWQSCYACKVYGLITGMYLQIEGEYYGR